MENQNEIMEIVEQGSSKKGIIATIGLAAAGIAAGVAGVIFWRKKKLVKQQEEVIEGNDVSEDSKESTGE